MSQVKGATVIPTITTNMGLAKPAYADTADIMYWSQASTGSADLLDAHDHSTNAKGLPVGRLRSGINRSADAPSPLAGTVYFDSSANRRSLYNGSAWQEYANLANADV